ncbi:MAG: glycosyltransferase family 2 protein [Candidatus Gastranaerophilaceae bacterium]
MSVPTLAIVVPCYNEEVVIDLTLKRLTDILTELEKDGIVSEKSFLFFVDDGSSDKTFEIIEAAHKDNPKVVKSISFTRNFGNQMALLAGMLELKKFDYDCCVTIDADLQQDETKIQEFVQKYKEGNEIVYGVKSDKNDVSVFKKLTSAGFYKIMTLLGAKTCPNHSEYRLVSRRVVSILAEYSERNIFLRGVFQQMGEKSDVVYYDIKKRFAGQSKFSLFDLISLALQGITSFSIVPLRLVTFCGVFISFCSFLIGFSAILEKIFNLSLIMVPGWATIVATISFIGGIQILCIGVIGEYLGQIFMEVKARPRYIVGKSLD